MDPSALELAGTCSCTCPCTCPCCGPTSSPSFRNMKRKLSQFHLNDLVTFHDPTAESDVISARVEIETEAAALRETLGTHQKSIQELYEELEEERSAAATAASEAMSMILRLQREKAETQMEFRQFKRLAEEQMSHDQEEIAGLEDLLFKRDQAVQSLSCEIQAYKHRLMSYGVGPTLSEPPTPNTATSAFSSCANTAFDYPPLRCKIPADLENDEEVVTSAKDLDKYAFGETPIQNIEKRIFQMERMPSSAHEKGVVAYSSSPRGRTRRLSVDSFGSFMMRGDEFPVAVERGWERDDVCDRVYTVDAVHCVPESYMSTPREWNGKGNGGGENRKREFGEGDEEEEIQRLYMRLQALEADRETMRQTIMSMGTDKAQLVLLKEIAQQLCKEKDVVVPQPPEVLQQKKLAKKPSRIRSLSIVSAMKWITSFVFWRRKSARTKYTFGVTNNNNGLLLLLDKNPRMRQKQSLSNTLR